MLIRRTNAIRLWFVWWHTFHFLGPCFSVLDFHQLMPFDQSKRDCRVFSTKSDQVLLLFQLWHLLASCKLAFAFIETTTLHKNATSCKVYHLPVTALIVFLGQWIISLIVVGDLRPVCYWKCLKIDHVSTRWKRVLWSEEFLQTNRCLPSDLSLSEPRKNVFGFFPHFVHF